MKRTTLYERHVSLGAKLIDFGGWEMPVQYEGIIDEHNATREHAGLFDVSHMGELTFKGKGAKEVLNKLITNDISAISEKKIVYTPIPNENGGVVDDMLIYSVGEDDFLLVVNASNTDKDFEWFKKQAAKISKEVEVSDVSSDYAQIAIQGPKAQAILQKLTGFDLSKIAFFSYEKIEVNGCVSIVSRTGYTGEDGFEIYCPNDSVVKIWDALLEKGKEDGIKPVGLGARDTLRFEAALPLYGHELGDDISPIESGLKFAVKPDKGEFLGKELIAKHCQDGSPRRLCGIELIDRGVPRGGFRVEKNGADVGFLTSGTFSPTFKKGLAMALLSAEAIVIDDEVDVIIRDKKTKAKIVKLPFYKKKTLSK